MMNEGEGPVVVKTEKPNPFGAARPREEVLADKGLDWKKVDLEIEAKKATSRPTSSQGSRPTSSQSNRSESLGLGSGSEPAVKPRPKVNPFGDAKPREVLLQEKGLDWRKMDLELEHRRVNRFVICDLVTCLMLNSGFICLFELVALCLNIVALSMMLSKEVLRLMDH